MDNNNNIENHDSNEKLEALHEAAACLIEYLNVHGEAGRPFEILRFLAAETIKHQDQNKQCTFTNLVIKDAVTKNLDNDPSAWLSPIWKKLSTEILPNREKGLQQFAFEKGYKHYAWPFKVDSQGGSGNQAHYKLIAKKVDLTTLSVNLYHPDLKVDIRYISAVSLKPSLIASFLFNKNNSAHGWRKWALFSFPIFWLLFTILTFVLVWLSLKWSNAPISSKDVFNIISTGIFIYVCRYYLLRFTRFFEDRIIMAPDILVDMTNVNVCLELVSIKDENNNKLPRVFQLVKYASECPICKSEVLLEVGEPDFPRRIVGRCQESPREHVYSFDRSTKTGYKLR
jgi:hypothetical protein